MLTKLKFVYGTIFLGMVYPAQPSCHHRKMRQSLEITRPIVTLETTAPVLPTEPLPSEEECSPKFKCDIHSKYRRIDGKCNNIQNPLWGSSLRPFSRYLPPAYEDGTDAIRATSTISSSLLPRPRIVSRALSEVSVTPSKSDESLMVMQWGQFLDHDLVLALESEIDCCDGTSVYRTSRECQPIDVRGDSFYSQFRIACLRFVRSVKSKCDTDQRQQVNRLTSYIDASQVYGSTPDVAAELRSFSLGRLKIGLGSEDLGTGSCPSVVCPFTFLPSSKNPEGEEVFITGDIRVEETPGLTSIHTIFVRVHNYIASQLKEKYQTKNDEFLYQETRRIVGAIMQVITYQEFLPIVLGPKFMEEWEMNIPSANYIYFPFIDVTASNVFATAAYRRQWNISNFGVNIRNLEQIQCF